jgi:hypothetical protein
MKFTDEEIEGWANRHGIYGHTTGSARSMFEDAKSLRRDAPEGSVLWDPLDAPEIAKLVEGIAPSYGFHVALTGGLLYKEGPRKDLDLVLYRIRQEANPDFQGLHQALRASGFTFLVDINPFNGPVPFAAFVTKASYRGRRVDFLYPEAPEGEYPC